jgi:phosphoglycerate dehydrogenase-like enzyme
MSQVEASPAKLNILVTDRVISRCPDELTSGGADGHSWTFGASLSDERIAALLDRTDVLVASRLPEELARAGRRLRLVHVPGAGYDAVSLTGLAPEVTVANTFHHGPSIAEHVVMAALMLSRRVLECHGQMRSGEWVGAGTRDDVPFGVMLRGQRAGIIGLGEIGLQTARLLGALGVTVAAIRNNPDAALPQDVPLAWVGGVDRLPELLASSDLVVITVPLTDATRGLLDASALARMPAHAFLINVARGAVIDEQALFDALSSRSIAGAAIDVWWNTPDAPGRPPGANLPFAELPNVIMTPHNSGSTRDTFSARARDIAENIRRLVDGEPLHHVVHGPRSHAPLA